jgi:acyl carrier protein
MTNAEIINKINGFLVEEFEVEDSVKDTLELDSLDYVDLVVLLEGNFNFKVKQEDFTGIATFQDLYNYVIGKVGAPTNAAV